MLLCQHRDVKSALKKIEEVTGVPRSHYESFQVSESVIVYQ